MSKELVISSNRHETKVGVLEDDQLVEVFFQRANEYSLAGSVHKGRVTRVLPGMQSAFVDLGLERDTFLYVSDFFEEHPEEFDPVSDSGPPRAAEREAGPAGPEQRDQREARDPRERDNRDRRDRGGRDRGGRDNRGPRPDRSGGRFEQPRVAEAAPVVSTPPASHLPVPGAVHGVAERRESDESVAEALAGALELSSPGSAEPVPAASASPVPLSGERPQGDRPQGDRDRGGDRGGDRRRRSRRRRTRGGFPENKYAQPGAHSGAAAAPGSASTPATYTSARASGDEPNEEEAAPREIILLPGESLAKYRNAAVTAPVVAPVTATFAIPHEVKAPVESDEEDDTEDDGEIDSSEVESSEEEHEILSHGEGAPIHTEPEVLSASLETALPRQPLVIESPVSVEPAPKPADSAPVGLVADATPVTESEPRVSSPSHDIEERHHADHLAAKLADEIRGDKVEPEIDDDEDLDIPSYLEEELADTETLFALPLDLAEVDLDPVDAPAHTADDTDDPAITEDFDVDATDLEAAVAESIEPAEPLDPNARAAVQEAFVRDQSNRSPHRMGRRMRRRRGGRGGQSSGDSSGAPQAGQQGSESRPATAAGPATSIQSTADSVAPEARLEVEVRAEVRPEARIEPREFRESREARGEQRGEQRPEGRSEQRERPRSESIVPSITDLLKPGQEIIVQIAKEPLGQKGARITSHIALPGRYVVFMPSVDHLGVSRKIASDEERLRLKRILQAHRVGTSGGFICRTAGEGRTEDEIAADMSFLYNLWLDIRQKAEKRPAPALLHHDLDVVQRILRDQLTDEYKAIWVDNEDLYESALRFVQRFQPALVGRVKMYTRTAPIFDAFGITQELEKALRPKVWLKSGGYIVINQTEALVAIDVNTGKYVGKSNRLEDTIVKTNTEAVKEIVRQVRLRDLGGIIVVDFIDMDERKNRQKVMGALEDAMRADKAPYKILQFNDFGLVAITRKRVKQSLERTLCAPCPYCEGAGYVKSVQTIIGEILIEAQKIARAVEGKDVMLRVHPDVAKILKSNNNQYLEELEEILGRPVLVAGDAALHHEKFDLA